MMMIRSTRENANCQIIDTSILHAFPSLKTCEATAGDACADCTGVSRRQAFYSAAFTRMSLTVLQTRLSPVHCVEPSINILAGLVLGIPISLL